MEITKEHADKLIKEAIMLLKSAHHGYYKNASVDSEIETDDMLCDALETLGV